MKPEISVALTLTGSDLNPDDITSRLDLEPTRTWRLGDQILNTSLKREHGGWSLSTDRKPVIDLQDQLDLILREVQAQTDALNELANERNFNVELACVIYVSDETPVIHFDAEVVELLAELNAEIDIDLYVLPSEEQSSSAENRETAGKLSRRLPSRSREQ
jgi:hypothetical protein